MKILHELLSKNYVDEKKEEIIYFCPVCKKRKVIPLKDNRKDKVFLCNYCYFMIKNTGVILDVNNF